MSVYYENVTIKAYYSNNRKKPTKTISLPMATKFNPDDDVVLIKNDVLQGLIDKEPTIDDFVNQDNEMDQLKNINSNLEKDNQNLKDEINQLKSELSKFDGIDSVIVNLKDDNQELIKKNDDLSNQVKMLNSKIKDMDKLQDIIDSKDVELNSKLDELNNLENVIKDSVKINESLKKEVNDLYLKIDSADNSKELIDGLAKDNDELMKEIYNLNKELDNIDEHKKTMFYQLLECFNTIANSKLDDLTFWDRLVGKTNININSNDVIEANKEIDNYLKLK